MGDHANLASSPPPSPQAPSATATTTTTSTSSEQDDRWRERERRLEALRSRQAAFAAQDRSLLASSIRRLRTSAVRSGMVTSPL